jgi:hypothetical protein
MTSATTALDDVTAVRNGFEAFAKGDLDAFLAAFKPDATWNHRNDDTLGGVHAGRDGIKSFIVASGQLTNGTLRAVPRTIMADGSGHVAVLTQVSGTRPDGRTFDDTQIMFFVLEGDQIATADQFIGDPAKVTAFWA